MAGDEPLNCSLTKRQGIWILAWSGLAILVLSIIFASTGVIKNDVARNIFIPQELTTSLRVKAAYDDNQIYWRFKWPAAKPSYYHDYLVYESSKWVRHGRSAIGEEKEGFYEDRLSFFIDDGSVDNFAEYGGFITVTGEMRYMTHGVSKEEAQQAIGKKDVRKFLPETRTDPADWKTLRSETELEALNDGGYFLDLWHWRAHRSNPIGLADDQYIGWYRLGDKGTSPYETNWNADTKTPKVMFNTEVTGFSALRWEKLIQRGYSQDDYYYLSTEIAIPYDASHPWLEGDVIPYRLLRQADGSRGNIRAKGRWDAGAWNVDLVRDLDTGHPRDDKTLRHLGKYSLAFAIHKNATGSRWHYVSLPFSLGLGRSADIIAERFTGNQPPWDDMQWTTISLFYPGQVTWNHVHSSKHAGYESVKNKVPVHTVHSAETLALYGVESEFRHEILRQWLLTTAAWTLWFVMASWAVGRIATARQGNSSAEEVL